MKARSEVSDYASILLLSASGAVLVWYAYSLAHSEIVTVEQAQGYVDPMLQVGITLGFIVMLILVAGLVVASIWSAIRLVRTWRNGE